MHMADRLHNRHDDIVAVQLLEVVGQVRGAGAPLLLVGAGPTVGPAAAAAAG